MKKNEMVIKPAFDMARPFSGGLAAVSVNGKWGYINQDGKVVVEPVYESADSFSFGLAFNQLRAP